jgi:AcrR family transcriptional regulator
VFPYIDVWKDYSEKSNKIPHVSQTKSSIRRLNRNEWLEAAMQVIADEEQRVLTIQILCEKLGVSRGSFYWHFKNRGEFVQSLIKYWEQKSTLELRDEMESLEASPEDQLFKLISSILGYKYRKFELSMRHWAMSEPDAREILQRIDSARYQAVRSLFERMGFTGDELEMRTQTCVIYYNFADEFSVELIEDLETEIRQSRLRHDMLTSL